jgi:hypothetical protein
LLSPLPFTLTVVVNCSFMLMRRISFSRLDQTLAQLFFIHKAEAQHVAAFVDSGDALIHGAHAVFCFVAVFGLRGDGAAPPLPQKEMPKVAFSAFIMSPSFISAATPGTTTARAPAFSAPAALFGLYPDGRQ